MVEIGWNPLDRVLPVLQDDGALRLLDALKPGFSVESSHRRAEMQRRLQEGELPESRALLQQCELLEYDDGEWRIPARQIRLAYQLVGSQRDEAGVVAAVAGYAGERVGGRWLDIACGSGALLRTARRTVRSRTLGVDLDSQALALARLADRAAGSFGSYACAPADQLPVADSSVDVATSIVSLQHFHVRPAIREMGRVLRPGGVLYLRLHGTGYYWELAAKYLRRRQPPVYAIRCLWHGLRVAAGLPQNQAVQHDWLKFEIPVSVAWVCRALAAAGVRVEECRVLRRFGGRPVFFEVVGSRSHAPTFGGAAWVLQAPRTLPMSNDLTQR